MTSLPSKESSNENRSSKESSNEIFIFKESPRLNSTLFKDFDVPKTYNGPTYSSTKKTYFHFSSDTPIESNNRIFATPSPASKTSLDHSTQSRFSFSSHFVNTLRYIELSRNHLHDLDSTLKISP